MNITDKDIESIKDLAQKHGKEYTDEEAREAAYNIHRYVEFVWEFAKKQTLIGASVVLEAAKRAVKAIGKTASILVTESSFISQDGLRRV